MANCVGIDLGTTFSAAAYIDESGRATTIKIGRDGNILPSCVKKEAGKVVVGEEARKAWNGGEGESEAAARFKTDMGTSETRQIDGEHFTPTELSAAVLAKIKSEVEKACGPIAEAVITTPANFSNEARKATMEAAQTAGLNVKYIINEPTAAALYYAYQAGENLSGTYAVFDLGGGTFDISVIRIQGHDVEVIASNGVPQLGGDNFDKCLWKLVGEKYEQETGMALTKEIYEMNEAEGDKISLSRRKKVLAGVELDEVEISITITRLEFEESISTWIEQIKMMCEATLEEAKITSDDIESVFLAGGSTRIPCVIECVEKIFGQEPTATVNVDEIVALGAAVYSAYKSDGTNLTPVQKRSISKMKMTEVTNEYYGVIVLSDSEARGKELVNDILLKKGQTLPCTETRTYYTVSDNQEAINCMITESKEPTRDRRFTKIVAEGEFRFENKYPAEEEIEVTYSYDVNQIMHADFKVVSSGEKYELDVLKVEKSEESSQFDIDKFTVEE